MFPFFSDLYNTGAEILDTKQRRLAELGSACASERLDGKSVHLPFPLIVILDTRAKMSSNKSPGRDGVTVEMLRLLDAPCLELIRDAFERRLNCLPGACDPVSDWLAVTVHCIPKLRAAHSLLQWRPLSLVATLAKWYGACLVYMLRTYSDPPVCNLFGFEPGRQCAEFFDLLKFCSRSPRSGTSPSTWGRVMWVTLLTLCLILSLMLPCIAEMYPCASARPLSVSSSGPLSPSVSRMRSAHRSH